MGPSISQKNNRVSVTKSSPRRQILRSLMVTSDDLMVIDASVGSHSARWVTTQLTAVVNMVDWFEENDTQRTKSVVSLLFMCILGNKPLCFVTEKKRINFLHKKFGAIQNLHQSRSA
jgi:hypothetical protein